MKITARTVAALTASALVAGTRAEEPDVQYESRVPNGASVLLCGDKPRLFGLM